jgi:hypothetical protein
MPVWLYARGAQTQMADYNTSDYWGTVNTLESIGSETTFLREILATRRLNYFCIQNFPPWCWVTDLSDLGRYWRRNKANASAISGSNTQFNVGISKTYFLGNSISIGWTGHRSSSGLLDRGPWIHLFLRLATGFELLLMPHPLLLCLKSKSKWFDFYD